MTKIVLNKPQRVRSGPVAVTVTSEPVTIDLDEGKLAAPIADAIRDAISQGIRSTSARNERGRQRWNRTGRLARDLVVVKVGAGFEVKAPPGYLADERMIEMLAADVPALAAPLEPLPVKEAIAEAVDDTITIKRGIL